MRKKYFHNTFVVYECAGIKTNQSTTQKEKEDYQDFNFIAVFEKKQILHRMIDQNESIHDDVQVDKNDSICIFETE